MNASTCKSCKADIFWVKTDSGKSMPIDAKPEKRIIVVDLSAGPDLPNETRARVVNTYVSHFVTCPNRDQHRKPKEAKNESKA